MGFAVYKILSEEVDPDNPDFLYETMEYLKKEDGIYDSREIIEELFDELGSPDVYLDHLEDSGVENRVYVKVDNVRDSDEAEEKLSRFKRKLDALYDEVTTDFSLTAGSL